MLIKTWLNATKSYLNSIVSDGVIQDRFESAEDRIWLIAWRSFWAILIQVKNRIPTVEDSILNVTNRIRCQLVELIHFLAQ